MQATILLDGADTTIMMQRIDDIPIADMRMGMRVAGGVAPEAEREATGGAGRNLAARRRDHGLGADRRARLAREQFAEHISAGAVWHA